MVALGQEQAPMPAPAACSPLCLRPSHLLWARALFTKGYCNLPLQPHLIKNHLDPPNPFERGVFLSPQGAGLDGLGEVGVDAR